MNRDFSEQNIACFSNQLSSTCWNSVLETDDPNSSFNNFSEIFKTIYDNFFNLKVKRFNKNFNKINPWMTHGLLVSRTNKIKLAKKCFENPSAVNTSAYKMYRNLYNSLIRASKKLYYAKILELNASNFKKTWSILNEAINKKGAKNTISEIICNVITVNNSFEIAQKFNAFFTSIATTFSNEINPSDTDIDVTPITNCKFDMSSFPVTSEELELALGSLQDKKTPDLNNVSMYLLKKVINLVKTPLIHIFSRSLHAGIVPDRMKIAKVVLIFKSGSHIDINNYRPISLLCSFSKILEKIVAGRLLLYLNSNNLI
jgi:hypothetical protein